MIFVTIGTQEPFDRLVKAMDQITPSLNGTEVHAQVSETKYDIKSMKSYDFLDPAQYLDLFSRSSLIVSHAGMGTIISAMQSNKPIIILPRLAKLGEHRNEHQTATAKRMDKLKYIHVAYNEIQLQEMVHAFFKGKLKPLHRIGNTASNELISSIQDYIK
jgi:UDP-N-acetylglucosamine transferase subunit ALG13